MFLQHAMDIWWGIVWKPHIQRTSRWDSHIRKEIRLGPITHTHTYSTYISTNHKQNWSSITRHLFVDTVDWHSDLNCKAAEKSLDNSSSQSGNRKLFWKIHNISYSPKWSFETKYLHILPQSAYIHAACCLNLLGTWNNAPSLPGFIRN